MIVTVTDGSMRLAELARRIESGEEEEILLVHEGQGIARIVPVETRRPFRPGLLDGQLGKAPDFSEPMDETELALWEGRG